MADPIKMLSEYHKICEKYIEATSYGILVIFTKVDFSLNSCTLFKFPLSNQ